MKVLMFGWEFPPNISGGLGTACHGLTKGLAENDVDIIFVMPKAYGDEDASNFRLVSADGMPVHTHTATYRTLFEKMMYWEVNSLIIPYLSPEEFLLYSEEQLANTTKTVNTASTRYHFTGKYGKDLLTEVWNYARVAAEIVANNTFDVIHVHDWLSFPAGIIAKEISGKPLVAHLHATEFDRSGGNKVNEQIYEIEREGLHHADKIIAVSELTRQIVINNYGIAPEKVFTIYNAVDDTSIYEAAKPERIFKEKIISYVGRITYQKGPDYFVEAAGKVLKENKNFRFIMAGSGDMLHQVVRRAAQLRISSHFHFAGFLKGGEVGKLFAMSDAYVMPSVSEPFGISPLEALRSGVPVIISKQSGVREILTRAISVDFFDVDAMADAIHALATYKSLANMVVRDSRIEMQNLKWITQAAKVKELYQDLVKN